MVREALQVCDEVTTPLVAGRDLRIYDLNTHTWTLNVNTTGARV